MAARGELVHSAHRHAAGELMRLTTEKERLKRIAERLPEAVDLWVVVLQAGLDFQVALQEYVAQAEPSPLRDELLLLQAEIRTGLPRVEALRRLRARVPESNFQETMQTLIQGLQLGGSLTPLLKAQSKALRLRQAYDAERRAALAPLKLMFPLFVFIFPTLLIALLGPLYLAARQGSFG